MGLLQADEIVLGEDTVDLLAVIEESFGVELATGEPILGKSVSEFARYISERSSHPQSECCLSSAAFYRLRRALLSCADRPRNLVRPNTRLELLFPWRSRRSRWRQLEMNLQFSLPPLTYPFWLFAASFAIATALSMMAWAVLKRNLIDIGLVAPALWSFVLWLLLIPRLVPFARNFPKGCTTIEDLASLILARTYAAFASEYGKSSEEQILALLRRLIASEVGLGLNDVTPQTIIPQGLDID